MKKLLFTLCAVLVGLSASALEAKYVDNSGAAVGDEVTIEPGKTLVLHVNVTGLETLVFGFQEQWVMRDVEGDDYATDGLVNLKKTAGKYFTGEGMSTFPDANLGSSNPPDEEVIYRLIATNTSYGFVWSPSAQLAADRIGETVDVLYDDYGCTDATFTQGNVFRFTIVTSADWNEEYATLDFDQEYDKLSLDPAPNSAKLALPDLKIKNANWQAPLEDLKGTIVVGEPDENGYVTVAYNGDETGVTVTVEGYDVVDGKIQLPAYDTYTLNVTASAEGYNPKTETFQVTWTAPAVAPEKPVIEITGQETAQMTITVTNVTEGATLYVNGQAVEGNSYTYTVDRTDIYTEAPDVTVTAKAVKDGLESETATATGVWVVATQPTADEPVIEFVETKNDKNEVTQVEVVVTKATSYKVFVDGEELRGEVINANYTATQAIHVEAENDPGYPYVKAENEADYTLNKLTKNTVAAPEVTPTTGDDAVTLNITWPESDGTQTILVNGQESTQTSFPRQDEDYNVTLDIYVTEGPTCAESAHYTQTITIPKKEAAPAEQTGSPVFVNSPYTKPNVNAYFAQLDNSEPGATIYYQVTDPDGNTTGWLEYTPGQEIACYGANGGGKDGNYTIEAYAQAPGKDPSKQISLSFQVGPTTGIDELIGGKAIANVRYFNMAGQEMQEANGMTIVVTTYTDGTTSAVKVMK